MTLLYIYTLDMSSFTR